MTKNAIVTGGSRRIGREIAKRLAADGFSVVINYAENAAKADEVTREISDNGGQVLAVKADVNAGGLPRWIGLTDLIREFTSTGKLLTIAA